MELKRINSIDIDTLNIIDITSPNDDDDFVPDAIDTSDEDDESEVEEQNFGNHSDDDDSKKLISATVDKKSTNVTIQRQDSHRQSTKLSRQRTALNHDKPLPPLKIVETSLIIPQIISTPPPSTSRVNNRNSPHSAQSSNGGSGGNFKFNLLSPPPSRNTNVDHFRFDTQLAKNSTSLQPTSSSAGNIASTTSLQATLPTHHTSDSEIVLSPAKLGQ